MTMSLSKRSLSPRTTIDNGSDPLLEKSPKKFRSTNTWLETKKIENALEERKSLLEEKRVEKLAQLSQGEWIPSSHLVKVTKQVGRHWATMGHSYHGELYLDPEEALFLLEANTIEIYFNGVPMSLQQAYSVLLGSDSGCTLEEYRAFAHLTRFGYKVRRHRPEVGGKRKREEPLEIDVVGVICRRKSRDAEGCGSSVVEVEDAVEVVDSVKANPTCLAKDLPSPSCHLPSTSQVNNAVPSVDDDDIKFLEIVDTSKRRKVVSSVVIHDDIEISLASNGNRGSSSSGQAAKVECDDSQKKESNSFKLEAEKPPGNSVHSVSDCELELVEDSNDKSRPSRGMYKSNLFTPVTSSSKNPECISSVNTPSTSRSNCRNEAKYGSKNEKISAPKTTETTDDVIVLSDDETKDDDKQARELLKFYKEISLIELIDISEEDEEGKAVSNAGGVNNERVDENYDFWGVLGRIPVLENGKLVIKIPAPPSQLIPLNIHPFRDEYAINMSTSLHRPCEGENTQSRQGSEGVRAHAGQGGRDRERSGGTGVREHRDSNRSFPQGRGQSDRPWTHSQGVNRVTEMNSYLLPTPPALQPQGSYSHHWQKSYVKNAWNPWMAWNHHIPAMNYNPNPSLAMNCWNNQYQANDNRPLWSSLVYSARQVGEYPTPNASQQWNSSGVSHFHHSAQQMNYQSYGQNAAAQYWAGNRLNQWQSNSSYSYGSRGGGGRWQRPSGLWPRRGGSRHYGRGGHCLLPRRSTPHDTRAENTFSASIVPKVPNARNWLELKIKSEKTKPTDSAIELKPSPEVNKEDSKDILPLLKPADSISIGAVQSKLQVTSSGKDNYYNAPENYESSLSIKFDLYMPNSNFKKSYPGLPKYRLSIVRSDDKIPKLTDTWYLTKDLNDEVPLLFGVSFTENINFFTFSNVELPAPMSQ